MKLTGDGKVTKLRSVFNKISYNCYRKTDLKMIAHTWSADLCDDQFDHKENETLDLDLDQPSRRSQELVVDLETARIHRSKRKASKRKSKARKVEDLKSRPHPNQATSNNVRYYGKGAFIIIDPPEVEDSPTTQDTTQTDSGSDSGFSDSTSSSLSPSLPEVAMETEEVSFTCCVDTHSLQTVVLESEFGERYHEAKCIPRRFAVQVPMETWLKPYLLFHVEEYFSETVSQSVR